MSVLLRSTLLPAIIVVAPCLTGSHTALAQAPLSAGTLPSEIVLTRLSPRSYPPLARQAAIAGDVKIQLRIRKDGSVASTEVVSGHAMLKQAPWRALRNRSSSAGDAAIRLPIC